MKKLLLLFVTLTCALLCGLIVEVRRHEVVPVPTAPTVGRYQLRTDMQTPMIFDTATGRIYETRNNGTFFIRDPVLETEPRTFSFAEAKMKPASTNQP
jgi:hypothetical protein